MRRSLLPALAAGLILLAAPAAQAATLDVTDVTGDVMTAVLDSSDNVTYHREHGAEGDITFARVQHTATQVVVYLRYTQLSVPRQYGVLDYMVEGSNGRRAEVDIETRHGDPQGEANVFSDRGRTCALSYRINYAGDSVSMRIPRRCLGKAKYVRLAHVTARVMVDQSGDSGTFYYDSPSRDGGTMNQIGKSFTPWVVTD